VRVINRVKLLVEHAWRATVNSGSPCYSTTSAAVGWQPRNRATSRPHASCSSNSVGDDDDEEEEEEKEEDEEEEPRFPCDEADARAAALTCCATQAGPHGSPIYLTHRQARTQHTPVNEAVRGRFKPSTTHRWCEEPTGPAAAASGFS